MLSLRYRFPIYRSSKTKLYHQPTSPSLSIHPSLALRFNVSSRLFHLYRFLFPFFFLLLLLLRRYFHSTSFHFLHPPSYFTLQLLILPLSPPSTRLKLASFVFCIPTSCFLCFPLPRHFHQFSSLSLSLHCNFRLFVHILSSVLILEFLFYCFLGNDCKIFRSKKRMDGNRIKEERSGKKNMGREDLNRLDSWPKSGRRLKKCSPFGEDLKWSAGRVRKKFLHSSFAKYFERGWEWKGVNLGAREQGQRNRGLVETRRSVNSLLFLFFKRLV